MKVEFVILATASMLALALAYPSAVQVAFACATVLAAKRIERHRKQRKQNAPRLASGR
jgi:hypothetical protein